MKQTLLSVAFSLLAGICVYGLKGNIKSTNQKERQENFTYIIITCAICFFISQYYQTYKCNNNITEKTLTSSFFDSSTS